MKKYMLGFLLLSVGVAGAMNKKKKDQRVCGRFITRLVAFICNPIRRCLKNYEENYGWFSEGVGKIGKD